MPTARYALEPGGPKRLDVSWGAFFRNATVKLDGNVLAVFPTQQELAAGQDVRLPDGSMLHVQLTRGMWGSGIAVLRDGRPVPGSPSDPGARFRLAYQVLFFIAAMNLLFGLIGLALPVELLRQLGIGWYSLVFGLVFLGLGLWAWRGSAAALIVAAVVYALDGIIGFIGVAATGASPAVGGLIFRALMLVLMIQGVQAARDMRRAQPVPAGDMP
jgi:hypothetical protein